MISAGFAPIHPILQALLGFGTGATAAYAAIVLLQCAEATHASVWRLSALLSMAGGVTVLHYTGLATLPSASGLDPGAGRFIAVMLASLVLAGVAIHHLRFSRDRKQFRWVHASLMTAVLCALAGSGVEATGTAGSYDSYRLIATLVLAFFGCSVSLAILRGLRVMPTRSLLPPRLLAAAFIGGTFSLIQIGIFGAASLATPADAEPLGSPRFALELSILLAVTLAALIRLSRVRKQSLYSLASLAGYSPRGVAGP